MANVVIPLEIPEGEDVARAKAAAEIYTGKKGIGATPKELLAAVVKRMTTDVERATEAKTPPGVI